MTVGYQLLRATPRSKFRDAHFFCAPGLSKCENFLRNFCINFGWDFAYTHKCHWPAKHQLSNSNQVQSDSLPSVSGDVTSGTQKMLKKGICKRPSGKWFLQESLPIPNFLKCIKNNIFFRKHLLSDFWGMLKTLLI